MEDSHTFGGHQRKNSTQTLYGFDLLFLKIKSDIYIDSQRHKKIEEGNTTLAQLNFFFNVQVLSTSCLFLSVRLGRALLGEMDMLNIEQNPFSFTAFLPSAELHQGSVPSVVQSCAIHTPSSALKFPSCTVQARKQ